MTSSADGVVRVFVLDDHDVVRRGLVQILTERDEFTVVGEARTAAEALRRIPATRPDVAVLDMRLPDGNGIDVCRQVRSTQPDVRCLILTSYDDDEATVAAVLAGAAGYVLKDVRQSGLLESIARVAAGESLLDPTLVQRVGQRLRLAGTSVPELTEREAAILSHITEGLTNRQIAERMFIAEKTVANNISGLLAKLGVRRRSQAAVLGVQLREQT